MTRKDVSLVLQLFLDSARLQKKRATLTIASIAWGTVTILLLLAFGEGLKRQFSRNERAMGENLAIHWPGETSKVWKGLPIGRPMQPHIDDIATLRERDRHELGLWRSAQALSPPRRTLLGRTGRGGKTACDLSGFRARRGHFRQRGSGWEDAP